MQEDAPTRTLLGELAAYVHASVREMANVLIASELPPNCLLIASQLPPDDLPHQVREMANVFFEEQRRRSYVTPKSFLELLGPRACKCSPRRPVHFPAGT